MFPIAMILRGTPAAAPLGTLHQTPGLAMISGSEIFAGDFPMRTMMAFAGVLCVLAVGAGNAEAGAWCAYSDPYTYNCGFRTLEQCRATTFGDSRAYCAPNPYGGNEEPRPRPRRRY